MKKLLMILGGLALAAVVAIVVVSMIAGKKFEPYAESILKDCEAGGYEKVYLESSKAFQKSTTLEEFRGVMTGLKRSLGAWKSIQKRTGGGMSTSTETGSTGSVNLVLAYENGPADGEFQFVEEDGKWKLLGLHIQGNSKTPPPADPSVREKMSRDLLALYDAQSYTALYARFSKPLQDILKADAYDAQMRTLFAKAGKVVEAERLEAKEPKDGRYDVAFRLKFEHGSGEASFGWLWADAEWHLLAIDIHMDGR